VENFFENNQEEFDKYSEEDTELTKTVKECLSRVKNILRKKESSLQLAVSLYHFIKLTAYYFDDSSPDSKMRTDLAAKVCKETILFFALNFYDWDKKQIDEFEKKFNSLVAPIEENKEKS